MGGLVFAYQLKFTMLLENENFQNVNVKLKINNNYYYLKETILSYNRCVLWFLK